MGRVKIMMMMGPALIEAVHQEPERANRPTNPIHKSKNVSRCRSRGQGDAGGERRRPLGQLCVSSYSIAGEL